MAINRNVRRVINSIKSKPIKVPAATPLGSAGYDNPRDDIEKTKSLRELSLPFTQGSVLFIGDNGLLTEDNFNLFWNDATNELEPNTLKIVSDGTQASPALKFNDTNTGFFKSGDTINLSINNSTKMTVDNDGLLTVPENMQIALSSNKFSQIGPNPINPTVSNAIDNLVCVKNSEGATTLRSVLASTAYTGSGDRANDCFGSNSFIIWTGTGDSTASTNAGVCANRVAFRARTTTSGTTVALAGGQAARSQIQGTANGFTVTEGYGYLAEGNQVIDATSEMTTSYNFWGRNFGTMAGTLTNNWGHYQEELTQGTYNVEFGTSGAGMYACRVSKGGQPTEYMNSDEADHLNLHAAVSIDLMDDVEAFGDLFFTGTDSGLPFAEIYARDNTTTTSTSTTKAQILIFDTDGESNNMTAVNAQGHIVVLKPGKYKIDASISIKNSSGAAHVISLEMYKNNGTGVFNNIHAGRTLGTGSDVGNLTMSGIVDLAANDTIEFWITSDSGAARTVTVEDIDFCAIQIGGT